MRRRNSHVFTNILHEGADNDRSGALGACRSGCLFSGIPPAADVVVSEEATHIAPLTVTRSRTCGRPHATQPQDLDLLRSR